MYLVPKYQKKKTAVGLPKYTCVYEYSKRLTRISNFEKKKTCQNNTTQSPTDCFFFFFVNTTNPVCINNNEIKIQNAADEVCPKYYSQFPFYRRFISPHSYQTIYNSNMIRNL